MTSSSAAARTILILHDEKEREPSQRLAAEAGIDAIALETIGSGKVPTPDIAVVNIDLGAADSVGRLRRMLGAAGHGHLLFAVDGGGRTHASRMQANALGAARVIPRPLGFDQLKAALNELGIELQRPTIATTLEAPPSIKAAAAALDSAFRTLAEGAPLNVPQVVDAGHHLLDGLTEGGAAHWLDKVREHHEGTFQHCLLVTGAAVIYGREAGLPERARLTLTIAALLHDIGKAHIPLDILDKPGKLSAEEYAMVRRHPGDARDYLKGQRLLPGEIVTAVGQHHELLDGSGYPDGLTGAQITPLARVLTVCDIYGALLERRSYKEPKLPGEAAIILADMAESGKVEYGIVRTLASALGVKLPEGRFRIT